MTEKRRRQNRESNARRKFTFKYISNLIYQKQVQSSVKRGHNPPAYTLEEMRSWMLKQDNLSSLMEVHKETGDSLMVPSINRLNDEVGYTFDNIELITWKENREIQPAKQLKPVIQMTLEGDFIKEWDSIREAARVTGIDRSTIGKVCKGKQKTAGKCKWEFKNN